LTCAVLLVSLNVAYTQYMTIMMDLQKALSKELKCLCRKSTTVIISMNCTRRYGCESLTILWHQKWINILYRNVCILYIHYINTLQVCMSTSGVVIHCLGWGCRYPNPKEIHCFKWEFYIQFVWHLSQAYPWHKTRPACIIDFKVIFCQYCNNGAHAIHCCISLHCVKFTNLIGQQSLSETLDVM